MKPKPIQVVRSRFNEITLLRSQGASWSAIGNELQVHANTLSILYQRELKRRTSPQYITATHWVSLHHDAIADLLARGFAWVSITNLIPVDPKPKGPMPTLEMLVAEYESVTASRVSDTPHGPAPVADPTYQSSRDDPPAPQPIPDPTPVALQSPRIPPPQPKVPARTPSPAPWPVTAQSQEVKGPFTGRLAEFNPEFIEIETKKKAEEERVRQRRERRENRRSAFDVKEDPYASVSELRAEYDRWFAIHRERAKLYDEIPESDDTRTDEKLERERLRDESNDMTNGYYRLIDARASHRLTNRSKLCVLSSAALACGVYTRADIDTPVPPDAITLYGFDRPDAIPGMSEIPESVIIRANLTQDEIERREASYHNDAISDYDIPQTTSPKRLLAEALILRGAYEFRYNGWIRYDEIVVLSGIDIPSPSLCGHPASRTQLTLAPPPLPDDPIRDDYPSDHRRDLIRERLKGDWL